MDERRLRTKLIAYAPWLIWLCFIFSNSLRSGASSSGQSLALLSVLRPLLGDVSALGALHILIRKLAHFGEFLILGALLMLGRNVRRPVWMGQPQTLLLISLLSALADETLQLLSPGRSAKVTDVWIDLAGAAISILICLLLERARRRKRAEKE